VKKDVLGVKRKIYAVQRELLEERTKAKAMAEELENPSNKQRWRDLGGKDPTLREMKDKVKNLQLRLIGKTEESVQLDLLLQERRKLHLELESLMAQAPTQEVVFQLGVFQGQSKELSRKMKAVAAELNMHQVPLLPSVFLIVHSIQKKATVFCKKIQARTKILLAKK